MPEAKCNATCKPAAQVYSCNLTSLTCEPAKPGTPGSSDKASCLESCHKPTPPHPPLPNNGTPTDLEGVWRGLQVSSNYSSGEWDAKFDNKSALFKTPSGQ